MGDNDNQTKTDAAKVPSEVVKAKASTPTSGQVPGGEFLAMGSDTSSIGSTRKFYRAAEKR